MRIGDWSSDVCSSDLFVGSLAGELRALQVDIMHGGFEMIVRLADPGAAEGVGLDDVGAGLEILAMHVADHVRPGDVEDVVVALQVAVGALEAVAAVDRKSTRLNSIH